MRSIFLVLANASVLGGSAVALMVFVSSCGGGSDNGNPMTPTPQPTPPPAASSTVSIVGDRGAQSFNPNPASVTQGQTVAWRNNDSVVHRIVTNDNTLDTGNIAPGATSDARALPTNGTNYHCTIHPGMIGAINASTGAPPPCTGPYCSESRSQ
jgi:plastocyanin